MIKTNEQLMEEEIDKELRGGEGEPSGERLVGTQDEGDDDPSDTTPEEAMEMADFGGKIIEEERKSQRS